MIEIRHLRKNIGTYETSAIVEKGSIAFELCDRNGNPVFETVYKETAEFSTGNSRFVYSFSDCEIERENMRLSARITRLGGMRSANGIRVYLSIRGEMSKNGKNNLILMGAIAAIILASGLVLFGPLVSHSVQYAITQKQQSNP